MKFKEVDAFRAVMRSGSMTAAASDLYTSQPNVSRLIAQLESSTGLTLFSRSAGKLTPTEEGIAFMREVDRAFVGLDALRDAARNIRQFGKGRLRIGVVPSLAMSIMPLVLQQFHVDHPDVTVAMDTANSQTVGEWVASRACDLGAVSYLPATSMTDAHAVCELAGCCVLPPEHRLTNKAFVEPADLDGESFISMAHGDGLRAAVDNAFAGADRRIMHFETPYGSTICHMVGLGLGVSIVSPLVARNYLHMGIQVRPFKPKVAFVSYLLLPRHGPVNALARRFATLLQQVITSERQTLAD